MILMQAHVQTVHKYDRYTIVIRVVSSIVFVGLWAAIVHALLFV